MRNLAKAGQALILTLLAAACADSTTEARGDRVAMVKVAPETTTVTVGDTARLKALVLDTEGRQIEGVPVSWSSSDTAVAVVSSEGTVRVLAEGRADIRASAKGQSGLARFFVTRMPVVTVRLSPGALILDQGGQAQLSATTLGYLGIPLSGRTVTWTTSDAQVATVNQSGRVTAIKAGSASIRATSEGKFDAATVQVTGTPVAIVVSSVAVAPAAASITVGGTATFTATLRDAAGSVLTGLPVTWTSTNSAVASVSAAGIVTGLGGGTTTIRASSGAVTGNASLTVSAAALQAVVLSPENVSLNSGAVQQFSVSGRWSDGATTAPVVTYSANGGTITSAGHYTAGTTAGTFRVIATQQGGTLADTSNVTVSAPSLQAVVLTPANVTLNSGATQQFSVTGQWSNGATTAPSVTYSATGGTISSSGVYTAGSTAGTFRVIDVQQGGTLADTSSVTVSAPAAPVLQAVVLSPASVSLATGATRQFSVSGQWSNGATTAPAVTYSATGGTVTSAGLFTAGATSGTFRVIAVQQGGTLADTSVVTIAAPVLQAVVLSPSSVSLTTGTSRQFSVSGQWSNGSTTAPAVTYSATGGTITASGMYTAGSAAGTFRVIAAQQGGTLADTATISLAAPNQGGLAEPTPSGNIFFDGRAGGAQSFQSATSLSQIQGFLAANGGVGFDSGKWSLVPDYNGSGKKALRLDWSANPSGESGNTATYYYPGSYSRVFTSVVIRLGRTATGGGNGSIGSFIPVTNSGGMKRFMWLRQRDSGTDRLYWVWPTGGQPSGNKISIDNRNFDTSFSADYGIGQDVRWTFELVAGNPGTLRAWRNGVLVLNNTNAAIGSLPFSESQLSTVRFAAQQSESEYWSDLVFWTTP